MSGADPLSSLTTVQYFDSSMAQGGIPRVKSVKVPAEAGAGLVHVPSQHPAPGWAPLGAVADSQGASPHRAEPKLGQGLSQKAKKRNQSLLIFDVKFKLKRN